MNEKVLVVDDVDTIARVYARFLERQGYEVRIAFNGEEAMDVWESFKPDLILSDIRMPRMNGFELSNAIRKRDPKQKIILMTGYGYPFFTKPADLQSTVLKIVQDVLGGAYKPQ
jgi:CheY-like chemotaxis protein